MLQEEIINQSLEHIVEEFGDPTRAVFDIMYKRFPELEDFRDSNSDWENYMMQEILENFMLFGESPESALLTIKDMLSHHRLIGVPSNIFGGMYQALFDVLTPSFNGPNKEAMLKTWTMNIGKIHSCIAQHEGDI